MVVLGHWRITGTSWSPDGTLHATNLLEAWPRSQWATWVVQPVPLFFVVGGWAGARSWRAARGGAHAWRVARLQRLLIPLRTFVVVGLIGGVVLGGLAGAGGAQAARLLGMPLWFLAVYLPVTLATPELVAAADRWGWRLPAGLLAAAALVDAVRFRGGVSAAGWVNFAFVWLALAALGSVAERRVLDRHAVRAVGAAASGALVLVVALHWYPVSMVGVGERSNNTPPTIALCLLGVVHACLAALAAPRLRAFLERRRKARRGIATTGALGMHLYLWHLCATVAIVGLQQIGFLNVTPLSGRWWLLRPVWVLCLAVVAVPLATFTARADLRRLACLPRAADRARASCIAATPLATVGLVALALVGFRPGAAATLAVAGIALATTLTTRTAASAAATSRDEGNPPWLRGTAAEMVEP